MQINKMILLEMGTFDEQFQRPFQAFVDGTTLTALQEASHYGVNFTPAALGAVSADIIRVSATTAGQAQIANGFDTGRLCFLMEVEFPGTAGMVVVEWLLGYTDHVGVQPGFANNDLVFDKNMRLFFNNVMKGRRVARHNAFGSGMNTNISGTYQLINHDFRPSINNLQHQPRLMRPQDVFYSMSMQQTRSMLGDEVQDVRSTHGAERIQVSNRRNVVPGQYVSAMLETWRDQTVLDEVESGSLNSQMGASVAEPTIARIRSLQELSLASELRAGGSMTWRELCSVDDSNSLEDRVMVVLAQSQKNRANLAQRGSMEGWHGNGTSTLVANQIVQSVPGVMLSLMLTELDFSVTNMTLNGEWEVVFQNVQSFNDGDKIAQVQAFKSKLINELMSGVSRGGLIPMEIHASFNVMGQTFLEVSIDGGHFTPYMAPSFCDGLFSNIRAPDATTLDRFADNLSKITTSLHQDQSAGGLGYEPDDAQFQTSSFLGINNENSGSL